MITLTPQAAKQVRISAEQSKADGLALRIAAKQNPDGSLEYGIGFDEVGDDDMTFDSEGVELVIRPEHGPLLKGATIDFVELTPGEYRFIFLNPNDPNYRPPTGETGGSCSGG